MSHITISMPSEPASRTYSMKGILRASSPSAHRLSRKRLSHSGLMRPARMPCSWCDMPPVPKMTTRRSSGHDSTARRIALPRLKQRLPVGGGNCTTFTGSGMIRHGQASGWPNISVSDILLVDDGHVELVEDQRLRDVARHLRMTDDGRHRARAPAFIRRRKL